MAQTPVPFSSSFRSLTLNVTTGTSPNQVTHTQAITSVFQGNNSFPITDANILTAFNSQPLGTSFTSSIVAEFGNALTTVSTPSVASFMPRVISLADIPNKLTTDASFSLSSLITTVSAGVLSYSSSVTSVATVNSSGQVTPVGAGTTTITVSQAATANHPAGTASRTFTVTLPPTNLFIDNSAFTQVFYGNPWEQHTTAAFWPEYTMAIRAKENNNGFEITVHMPSGLGFGGSPIQFIAVIKFQKKVNGVFVDFPVEINGNEPFGYHNGELMWKNIDDTSSGIAINDTFRARAAYWHIIFHEFRLNEEYQVKYSEEFTYYGN